MPSGIYNGTKLRLGFDDKKLLHTTSCKIDFQTKLEEIATKDTDGTVVIPSNYSWSASAEALVANLPSGDTTHVTFDTLLAAQLAGTEIDINFTTDETGDIIYTGKAYIENASITANVGESAKVSFSLKGNGNVVLDTVAA